MNEVKELLKMDETIELLKAQNDLLKRLIAVNERIIEDKKRSSFDIQFKPVKDLTFAKWCMDKLGQFFMRVTVPDDHNQVWIYNQSSKNLERVSADLVVGCELEFDTMARVCSADSIRDNEYAIGFDIHSGEPTVCLCTRTKTGPSYLYTRNGCEVDRDYLISASDYILASKQVEPYLKYVGNRS